MQRINVRYEVGVAEHERGRYWLAGASVMDRPRSPNREGGGTPIRGGGVGPSRDRAHRGPLGLRVDGSSPWVDARLPDGSRVHTQIPPLSLRGPALTVRKFSPVPITTDDLLHSGG